MNFFRRILTLVFLALPLAMYGQSTEDQAKSAFSQCKYNDAANLYDLAAQMAESNNQTSKAKNLKAKASNARKAHTLQQQGNVAWNNKDYSTAETKYRSLLKINSGDKTAKSRLATIEGMQGTNSSGGSGGTTGGNKGNKKVNNDSNTNAPSGNAEDNNSNTGGTNDYAKQLEQALYWYGEKEYEMAMKCFNKAGSSTNWNKQQLDAWRVCKMEYDYLQWKKTTNRQEKQTKGESYLTSYPSSSHCDELHKYLYDSYMQDGTSSSYDKALKHAFTTEQRNKVETAKKQYKKDIAKMNRRDNFLKIFTWPADLPWGPKLGVSLEVAGLINETGELAMPLELQLFEAEKMFNISIGGRIAHRGNFLTGFSIDSTIYSGVSTSSATPYEYSYTYWQLSPYLNMKLFLTTDHSSSGFYISAFGRMNYNFGYSWKDVSTGKLLDFGEGDDRALNDITFSVGGEFGMGDDNVQLYIYYHHDLTTAVNLKYNSSSDQAWRRPLAEEINNNHVRSGFLGLGMRVYL
ncbi:MAG: hypothetical protein J6X58_00465 [Bacteroidales bacterium]|nr:hypothetical protein [Bacteroidales bacterium]